MANLLYYREPLELDYDKKPLLCSKDDSDVPDFIPITCPICFEIIWDSNKQIKSCKVCKAKICKICLDKMKQTRSLYNTDSNNRKYLPCPICRGNKYNTPQTDDIESQITTIDTTTSRVVRAIRPIPERRPSTCKSTKYGFVIVVVLIIIYFIVVNWN